MYILTRYVVWEVLKFFLAALAALTLVVTLGMGVKEGFHQGLPAMVMLRTMPYMLPEMLEITVPVALLFSLCSVFGRMTGANEVVALKSLGISPMAVVWPVIVLAAFLSLGTVWMYEIAATWGKPRTLVVIADSAVDIAYGMLQKNHSYECDQFSIAVKRVVGRKLMQPKITIAGPPRITLSADVAELFADPNNSHRLWIKCTHSDVDIQRQGMGNVNVSLPDEEQYPIELPAPTPPRYHRFWVAMRDIPDLVAELQTTLRQLEQLRRAGVLLGSPDSPDDNKKIAEYGFLIRRLRAEPYRRWANGFTCLCFALIGAPVAMLWRHADVLTNFFVCFLPILAVYYPLLMLSDDFSTSGTLWPIFFWTANVVLTIPAIVILRWIVRH